ncbi:MAG: ABC transporter substrate-binding protein [Thermodesulfobacteriota bacterium]
MKWVRFFLIVVLNILAFLIFTQLAVAQFKGAERAVQEAKKYAGTTIHFTFPAGMGALDPKTFSGPLWEKLTGIKVNVIEIPTNDLFAKTLAEHRAQTGAYDVVSIIPSWLGDMVSIGLIDDLEPYIKKYGYQQEIEDIEPAYRNQMYWGGKVYFIQDDGDVFVLYYRKDLFANKANQDAFKKKYGYDLAPPTSWKQFSDIAWFFTETGKPDLHGAAIQRNPGQLHYFFAEWFRNAGGKFFNENNMKATINSDIGIKVLTEMMAQNKFMPQGAEAWGPMEVMKEWLAGKLAMTVWWPPLGRYSAGVGKDEKALSWVPESKVKGKVGYASTPGGHPELALGGGYGIAAHSKNKDAAYLFIQWLTSAEISLKRILLPTSLKDPFRRSHFESREFKSLWPEADEYLKALRIGAQNGLSDLSIRNTFKYQDALIRGLQTAISGGDIKDALNKVAEEWDKITNETGVDKQRETYKTWASKTSAYPR